MKTKANILLQSLVFSGLLLAISPQLNSRLPAQETWLSGECSSNKLTLLWYGAPGLILQQTTNLVNPVWQDVPGSKGMSFCELPMTNTMAFFRVMNVDSFTDTDADGLDDFTETNGWLIAVDTSGYCDPRIVELRHVTSDPSLTDTDGDGLDDFWEWMLGTDPRSPDTDRDGLTDYEEWFRWMTSPTSVDTDGDARGPDHNLPPSATLFDGNELTLLHTSPTLDDTDGDGRTDYEEYDQPGRKLLVAELPKLDVQMVDDVDIRLDVQYAEEAGSSHEYGSQLTKSESASTTESSSWSVNASLTLGVKASLNPFELAEASAEVTVGGGHTWGSDQTTSEATENAYSDYTTDSRTRTETAASGSMSSGIRLVNTGPITYTIKDFGLTVRYWAPGTGGTNREFKTLATLVPALGANGITLAPGDSTPVLQVQATGLNASRVKEFMARPNSLYLEPAFYELENAQGLNFDYLEEVTRWRTARVQIDYGNGTNEEYRVATNVGRNQDGSYAGVTMGNVLSNILQIPFQTVPHQSLQTNSPTDEDVLYSVRNVATTSPTNGFWIVGWSGEGTPQLQTNFDQIVLHAGDQILLSFIRDDDGDGLFAPEEQFYGTDDSGTAATNSADSDGDGLSDVFEARTGWDVGLPTGTYHVYPDPRQADQDKDGLTDQQEFQLGTDPTRPDTDGDGVPDGFDPHPLAPARVLRVNAHAAAGGNGLSWATAFNDLQDALAVARAGQATTNNPDDDVAEIWVAAGVYRPTNTTDRTVSFRLVRNTALYGGFLGVETKLSQREPNPIYNGTVLSGDLLGNDTSTYGQNTNSFADNSYNVCVTDFDEGSGAVLDGFTITGGNARISGGLVFGGGLRVGPVGDGVTPTGPAPRLKNLLFRANHADGYGGGLSVDAPGLAISDCLFIQNSAEWSGGGMFTDGGTSLTNCQFIQNEVRNPSESGGAGLMSEGLSLSLEGCLFSMNLSKAPGGAISLSWATSTHISRCRFLSNISASRGGGVALDAGASIEVVQSVFAGNASTNNSGGGIYISEPTYSDHSSLYIVNSTFCTNTAKVNTNSGGILVQDPTATTRIENSILSGSEMVISNWQSQAQVLTSCLSPTTAAQYPWAGNISADPKFVNATAGDLRLAASSPCIDVGNNYVDYHPAIFGFQTLPATDLDGNWRIVDGNNDGTATVDMGAYEYQQ